MLRNSPFALAKAFMVLMVALGLLLSGFAHRPVPAPAQFEQILYLAEMGLTAADLCADPGEGDDGMGTGDCPACQLAASILVPEHAASLIDVELRFAAAVLVPAQTHVRGRTINPATPVRAPPLA